MPNTFEDIETLIARELENTLSAEEQATLQAWLEADVTNRRYYDELRKTWELTATTNMDYIPDTNRNWEKFRQQIQSQPDITEMPVRTISPYRNVLRIAATLLLLAGAATMYFILREPQEIIITTAALEKKEVKLPDGSKVFMNQHSRLRYTSNLTGTERAVYLEGEAFFDVAHEQARPFVVYTNSTQTQVLGTSFDIKAYDAQPVEVAVLSGKVAVSRKTEDKSATRLVLTKGRKAIFKTDKQMEEIAIADPNFMAWKENVLRFSNVPLRDVISTLSSYYNVQIIIEDSAVANYDYKGDFFDAPKLEDVLDVIATAADLSWVKEQGQYKLRRKIQ
ncbi:FecR family protein [Chitinophaga sp. CF118]|uniref:FecR family protein n=1 Tax=Chitinophaga sp. CF118 TaxID=1884367 RepID=UPI0008ED7F71|nr:FecR domain-containing protein [Chitinophaga sp. CF118]SFE28532.1 FecR family protein [Chitinophaga sp. CF118]